MAKRKRNGVHANAVKKPTTTGIPSPPQDSSSLELSNINSVISAEEIEITVETLQTLSAHPALIKSKACKDIRTAVYDFRQACTTGQNSVGEFSYPVHLIYRANETIQRAATSRRAFLQLSQTPSTWTRSFYWRRCASGERRPHSVLSVDGCGRSMSSQDFQFMSRCPARPWLAATLTTTN
jgi:hypothetical protein